MKRTSIVICLLLMLLCVMNIAGQKAKSKTSKRKQIRTLVKPLPKPIIEQENWQQADVKELKIKISFPKEPTTNEITGTEGIGVEIKSSVVQTYINGNFYMLEVREYPRKFLPNRSDLGESYADWLKTYILKQETLLGEKNINFGKYKGVEFVYQQTEKDIIIHRVLVVGQKLYQMLLQIEIQQKESIEQTIEKNKDKIKSFFESFELYEENLEEQNIG